MMMMKIMMITTSRRKANVERTPGRKLRVAPLINAHEQREVTKNEERKGKIGKKERKKLSPIGHRKRPPSPIRHQGSFTGFCWVWLSFTLSYNVSTGNNSSVFQIFQTETVLKNRERKNSSNRSKTIGNETNLIPVDINWSTAVFSTFVFVSFRLCAGILLFLHFLFLVQFLRETILGGLTPSPSIGPISGRFLNNATLRNPVIDVIDVWQEDSIDSDRVWAPPKLRLGATRLGMPLRLVQDWIRWSPIIQKQDPAFWFPAIASRESRKKMETELASWLFYRPKWICYTSY